MKVGDGIFPEAFFPFTPWGIYPKSYPDKVDVPSAHVPRKKADFLKKVAF